MKITKRILSLLFVVAILCSMAVGVSAAPVAEATIGTTKTGSMTIYKYDLTNGATRS